jgi:hypothetical protein
VSRELAEQAVSALEPEIERARRLLARGGATAKTARRLASQGFAPDSIEAAIAEDEGAELG